MGHNAIMVSSAEVWGKANPRSVCTSRCQLSSYPVLQPLTQSREVAAMNHQWAVTTSRTLCLGPGSRSWLDAMSFAEFASQNTEIYPCFFRQLRVCFWWYFEPCLLKRGMWDCALISYWCLVKFWMHNGRGGLSILTVHYYCYLLYCASGYAVWAWQGGLSLPLFSVMLQVL